MLIRKELAGMFNKLTDTEKGKLLSALMDYQWNEKEPVRLPEKLFGVFLAMQSIVDSDNLKYEGKCETNRDSANKRWKLQQIEQHENEE